MDSEYDLKDGPLPLFHIFLLLILISYLFLFNSEEISASPYRGAYCSTRELQSEIGRLGMSFGSGAGMRDITPYRLGIQYIWYENSCLPLYSYLEFSLYRLKRKPGNYPKCHNTQLNGVALTPVFRIEPNWGGVYIEAAVGASRLSRKEIAGRELGMHFEFEDRLGAGFRFGSQKQFDLSYRFLHFSNANLGKSNNGINLHFVILGFWF